MRKIAIVTDVVDIDFFFPIWFRYYSQNFGADNLFVVCYNNTSQKINEYNLGGIVRLPSSYQNQIRCRFISSFCSSLLKSYDYVIRVDVDEFLVADPKQNSNILDYMNALSRPYVTAFGLDIIQGHTEPTLDPSKPILLSQRKYAYPNTSLNKTCITSLPIEWLEGFHFCNYYPKFDHVYIFHLRLADMEWQKRWASKMLNASPADAHVNKRYALEEDTLRIYREGVLARTLFSIREGLFRPNYQNKFFSSIFVERHENIVFYCGDHFHDHILIEISDEFHGIF